MVYTEKEYEPFGPRPYFYSAEIYARPQPLTGTFTRYFAEQVNQISGYLDTWDNVSFDDKRRVVDLMITTVAATSDSLNITWKI